MNRTFAFINAIRPPHWGGLENWMVNCARMLAERGHRTLIIGNPNSIFLKRAEALGVETRETTFHGDFDPRTISQIRRLFRQEEIDLLCVNMNKDLRLGGIAARLTSSGIPIIARKGMVWLKNNIRFRITYNALVDGIIVPSESLKGQLQEHRWLKNEITVIPVGLDPEEFRPDHAEYRKWILSRHDLPEDAFIVGTASRLAEHKGHQDLLPAMARIFAEYPNARLVMVGTGVDKEMIEGIADKHGIRDKITFVGYVGEREKIIKYMGGYDLFVLPSHKEPFGQVLIEAMSLERPIVACGVDGIPGVVADGQTADLVPPHSPEDLYKAIKGLIEDSQRRDRYGKNGRSRVMAQFTMDRMIDSVEQYFMHKIEEKRANS